MNAIYKKQKMFEKNKSKISKFIRTYDLYEGNYYILDNIKLVNKKTTKLGNFDYHFEIDVYSWNGLNTYKPAVRISDTNEILEVTCNCSNFKNYSSCSHLASVFINYSDVLFKEHIDINKLSLNLLEKYSSFKKEIKKEVFIEIYAYSRNSSFTDTAIELKVKIGENKMYSYGAHQSGFITAYENENKECKFGKDFIFSRKKNFFSDNTSIVVDFLNNNFPNMSTRYFYPKPFIKLLNLALDNDIPIYFNDSLITSIIEDFPFNTKIEKDKDNKYKISFDLNDFIPITEDFKYIYNDDNIYKLSIKYSLLIKDLTEYEINNIIVPPEKLELFSKSILPIIKSNTKVDEKIKDEIVIVNKPNCKLYFDLNTKYVICNLKFVYNDEINYFDKSLNILRDDEYESEVISEITALGFNVDEKNKDFILQDLEDIIYLKEEALKKLNEKYEVFTTEKFNNLKVSKSNVKSMFSIGQNNILSYNFDLGDINKDEIVNIFKDIKENKKYYRLKDGNILDLTDEKLTELMNLTEELEITDDEIIRGKGSILKYRAIYLDSIKKDKYHIIETDNLFDEFISNFHKYKDSNISLNEDDLKLLRDYQTTGVKWLYNLDKTGFGGILADEMGLGKTLQTIYYIKEILKEDKDAKFLIVVPTSLVYNWEHEFKMYAKDIKTTLLVGTKSKRSKAFNSKSNVFITTYGLVREDEEFYKDKEYHAIIIDEAQNIKNPLAMSTRAIKKINSKVKFALTGTPLENSTIELWSIFDFIMPGYLSTQKKFNSKYKINDFNDKTNNLISGLSNQITPFILRRLKKDVIKELPSKLENNIYIDLSDEQKKIYVTELDKVNKEIEKLMEDGNMSKVRFLLLPLLTKLRQICIDPKIVYEDYNGNSNKIDRFLSIVDESIKNGHKILVFTSFKSALKIAKDELKKIGIDSYVIEGNVSAKERMDRVNSFNNDKDSPKVFLIMLKAGGTGLNLTSADIVIHLDLWWNPQAENQATDRAHRIGQKNVVNVIRLVSKGTIEEKVLELQEKKKELSDKLLDASSKDKNILSTLSEKDIKNLLSYENK